MTDPGFRDDDGRDLHAALGGLLTDEPTAPWSVQDDVRRGQALRTRRRTRALGGVGIAAALVLVAGVLGPRGPWATQQVVGSSSAGLDNDSVSALLETFGWQVSDVADVRNEPDPTVTKWSVAKADGVVTASLAVRLWTSSNSGMSPSGSVIAACTADGSCGDVSASVADCVGSPCWSSASTVVSTDSDSTPAGTAVVLGYDDVAGLAVELVATPATCATCSQPPGAPPAFLSDAELQQMLGLIESQMQLAPTTAPDDAYGVAALLARLGWNVRNVTVAKVPQGQPSLTLWAVDRDEGAFSGSLTVRTWSWDARKATMEAVRPASVIGACTANTCIGLATKAPACEPGARCWSETTAITSATVGDAESGSFALLRQDLAGGRAVEVVAGPQRCAAVCPGDPYPAFLSEGETAQVADLVQQTVEVAPSTTPTSDVETACMSDDVKLIAEIAPFPTPAGITVLRVRVIPRNPDVSCTLGGAPTVEPRGRDGVLPYDVSVGSRAGAVLLDGVGEAQFTVTVPVCAQVGGDLTVLRVTLPGGGDPLDVQVAQLLPLVSCAVGPAPSTEMTVSTFAEGDPRECTSGEVTMTAVEDPDGGRTGERSVRVEVRPSSSDVRCSLTQQPDVALMDGTGAALAFQQTSGAYQRPDETPVGTVLLRDGVVGYVTIAKYRCDVGDETAVASLRLALTDGQAVPVALPAGLGGLARCKGGSDDAGNTVWISPWGQV